MQRFLENADARLKDGLRAAEDWARKWKAERTFLGRRGDMDAVARRAALDGVDAVFDGRFDDLYASIERDGETLPERSEEVKRLVACLERQHKEMED